MEIRSMTKMKHSTRNRVAAGSIALLALSGLSSRAAHAEALSTTSHFKLSAADCKAIKQALTAQHSQLANRPDICTVTLEQKTVTTTRPRTSTQATYTNDDYWSELCSPKCGALALWQVKVYTKYKYNGKHVYTRDGSGVWCSHHGIGSSISTDWCGTWNNGGGNDYGYMNMGGNFTVSVVAKGTPIHLQPWIRINVDRWGRVWVQSRQR
jgi:hypothetical protein